MTQSKQHYPSGTIKEQASYWVLVRHSGSWSDAEEAELQAWMRQGVAYLIEYEYALKLWKKLDQFQTSSFPARQTAHLLRAKNNEQRKQVRKIQKNAVTGLLILCLAVGIKEIRLTDTFHTGVGERKTIILEDGSKLTLNTNTNITVRINDNSRQINLKQGEVYIIAAHEKDRPFDVIAGNGRIRDIGTRFNVYADGKATQVTVAEGKVAVIPDVRITGAPFFDHLLSLGTLWFAPDNFYQNRNGVELLADEQLVYNAYGETSPPISINHDNVIAWHKGRLVFEMASLEEVLTQVQRYYPVKFEYAKDSLKHIQVSASFEIDNLQTILNTLQTTFPIIARQFESGRIILSLR